MDGTNLGRFTDSKTELLNEIETRQVDKSKVVETDVIVIHQGRDPHGDRVFTFHPKTGNRVDLNNN